MSLQLSRPLTTKDHAIGSIDISSLGGRSRPSGYCDQAGCEGTTLPRGHLDVALAIEAPDAQRSESRPRDLIDPVLRQLSDALAATEALHHPHSAILADALRLAILTHRASAQAVTQRREAEPDVEEREGRARRTVRSLQKWRLKRVMQYVDENLGAKITLEHLAAVAGLSRMHFAAQFRAAVGMRPHEYLLKCRIERAQELLKQGDVSLVDTALTVGFQTQAHFTTVFKRFVGDTPYQWRSAYLAQFMPLPRAGAMLS
ncbi:MAG: helix-turn-helix domain-containing protein [Bradyrhizobium sp.]|jgi:AraC-like DNA-binding protein|uniref:helix-turn-helix domain-containing protein n=1 Tax=Bradyrhizobium TaxID=374 RepID=UPI000421137D|nr:MULTISPECIES: AraC family transcriptional regulator [Bradyrhizobium]KQT19164.1 AraC family transcriptional regulator [Bradyrhizobium sp. Leaf396]